MASDFKPTMGSSTAYAGASDEYYKMVLQSYVPTAEQIIKYAFGNKNPNKRSFLSPCNNGQKLEIVITHLRKLGIIE